MANLPLHECLFISVINEDVVLGVVGHERSIGGSNHDERSCIWLGNVLSEACRDEIGILKILVDVNLFVLELT